MRVQRLDADIALRMCGDEADKRRAEVISIHQRKRRDQHADHDQYADEHPQQPSQCRGRER